MNNYARIINNVAVDVSLDPGHQFHPSIAAEFVEVPSDVSNGWRLSPDSKTWSAPELVTPTNPEVYPKLSPLDFKMCLTSAERLAVKSMVETDVVLADFYEIIEDPRLTEVDMGLQSVRDAIGYMFTKLAENGVVAAEDVATRIEQVISGTRL